MKNAWEKSVVFVSTFALIASSGIGLNSKAFAAENNIEDVVNQNIEKYGFSDPNVGKLSTRLFMRDVSGRNDINKFEEKNSIVTPGTENVEKISSALSYMGSASLSNYSYTQDQPNMDTQSFTETFTDATSTTTTKGWKVSSGISVPWTIKKDSIGIGFQTSAEFSWSQADTKSTSTSRTYTSPAQRTFVPKRTRAEVKVQLLREKYKVPATLESLLQVWSTDRSVWRGYDKITLTNPNEPPFFPSKYYSVRSVSQVFGQSNWVLPDSMKLEGENIRIKGEGTIEQEFGSDYKVETKLYDIDSGQPRFLKQSDIDKIKESLPKSAKMDLPKLAKSNDSKGTNSYSYTIPIKKEDVVAKK
ncbi:toxin ETX/toxin MTX2 [Marininema mesophilum]|uniref:Toxin ETX/toxin MTX2 n=1 Tax=Marininema mesophilum TaxID=1048340 RepID=A0A1H2YJC7_9BACL|nr:ETX/MTX2 family pore-forming toxin [Marininema mesophilum]SDX05085.1 toxin ETX/toxin MTX2 [Marininema mesophilum]